MKPLPFILIFCFSFCVVQAQKENNIWVGGQMSGLDFNSDSADVFLRDDNIIISRTSASICNKNGSLLFYTNGYYVMNKNYKVMQNGNGLNIGDYGIQGNTFLTTSDAAAIIPVPGDSNKYYIFHTDLNFISWDTFVNVLMPTHLFYCIIDMSLNNGLGDIVQGQKDVVILSDTLTECGFKLVKHANGRDYWLVCHENNSNKYYRFLIDPYGVHGPYEQIIGYDLKGETGIGFSILIFNNEANMAAQIIWDSTSIQLYDFDRCSGEFSNCRNFKISDTSYSVLGGVFSPNGKYFYATANGCKSIWQFDVTTSDIFSSRKLIAQYDGIKNPFNTDFFKMNLGPDNKIYINSYDFNFSLHRINSPDSSGKSCAFLENAIQLQPPGYDWNGFPNIVNYSLGALPGACDSLTGVTQLPLPVFTWGVYPNPFTGQLNISITGASTDAVVEVFNLLGERMYYRKQKPTDHFVHSDIDLSMLSAGMYIVKVVVNGKEYEGKVVKE